MYINISISEIQMLYSEPARIIVIMAMQALAEPIRLKLQSSIFTMAKSPACQVHTEAKTAKKVPTWTFELEAILINQRNSYLHTKIEVHSGHIDPVVGFVYSKTDAMVPQQPTIMGMFTCKWLWHFTWQPTITQLNTYRSVILYMLIHYCMWVKKIFE